MKKSSINCLKRCSDTDLNAIREDYFSFIKNIFTRAKDLSRIDAFDNLKELDPLIFLHALVKVLAVENRLHAKHENFIEDYFSFIKNIFTRAKDLSRIDAFDNLKELDPLIFLHALVEVLAVENRLHAKAALNALMVYCETLLLLARSKHADVLMSRSGTGTPMIVSSPSLSPVYSPPPSVKVPIFDQLLPRLLHCCACSKGTCILLKRLYDYAVKELEETSQESSTIHSNVKLDVHGQGLLNLSGTGDCIGVNALCSWDPSKRPKAMVALQHPFFQSYYYIPPSLRSKAATTRMSPSGMFMVLDNSLLLEEPTIHDAVLTGYSLCSWNKWEGIYRAGLFLRLLKKQL
nr:transformation/transcription domain-associated protein isoform X2 [Tanacetum cinerariifolium]